MMFSPLRLARTASVLALILAAAPWRPLLPRTPPRPPKPPPPRLRPRRGCRPRPWSPPSAANRSPRPISALPPRT